MPLHTAQASTAGTGGSYQPKISLLGLKDNAVAFTTVEVVYYAVLWLLAFLAGITRAARDHNYQQCWDLFAVGAMGGFYGFATVSILSHYGPNIGVFGWGYLGVAAAVGSLGKEQDRVMRWIFVKAIEKITGSKYDEEQKP